jgi:hypothetical protein
MNTLSTQFKIENIYIFNKVNFKNVYQYNVTEQSYSKKLKNSVYFGG